MMPQSPTAANPAIIESPFDQSETVHTISLGAGVQSTVVYLMAAEGLIRPTPAAAIFADTRWEPSRVYRHLEWLESLETPVPIPVVRVSGGDLYDTTWRAARTPGAGRSPFTEIPTYVYKQDGSIGQRRRQCTQAVKIKAIIRKVREIAGRPPGRRGSLGPWAVQWMGISTDEAHRMRDARDPWLANRYPLVDMRMSRADCIRWFEERYPGRELAKSSCVGCPYHSNRHWLELYREEPEDMERTMLLDEHLRSPERIAVETSGIPQYLHRSGRPLREVIAEMDRNDRLQLRLIDDHDTFGEECDGYCNT